MNDDVELERVIEIFPGRRRLAAGLVVATFVLSFGTVVAWGVWRVVRWVWR